MKSLPSGRKEETCALFGQEASKLAERPKRKEGNEYCGPEYKYHEIRVQRMLAHNRGNPEGGKPTFKKRDAVKKKRKTHPSWKTAHRHILQEEMGPLHKTPRKKQSCHDQ